MASHSRIGHHSRTRVPLRYTVVPLREKVKDFTENGLGQIPGRLRALAALAEDPDLIPSTPTR